MPGRLSTSLSAMMFGAGALISPSDPRSSSSITESIIAVLLVITFIAALLFGSALPMDNELKDVFVGAIGIIIGAYFNQKGQSVNSP